MSEYNASRTYDIMIDGVRKVKMDLWFPGVQYKLGLTMENFLLHDNCIISIEFCEM